MAGTGEGGLELADPFASQQSRIVQEEAIREAIQAEEQQPMKLCHNCKTLNKAQNKFCSKCGEVF